MSKLVNDWGNSTFDQPPHLFSDDRPLFSSLLESKSNAYQSFEEYYLDKRFKNLTKVLKNKKFMTKIQVYFSYEFVPDYYDPYENNTETLNLNAKTIKGYVSKMQQTSLIWKEYGLQETGAVQVLCDKQYKNYFMNCVKAEIDGQEYTVYRDTEGNRQTITENKAGFITVVLSKKGTEKSDGGM